MNAEEYETLGLPWAYDDEHDHVVESKADGVSFLFDPCDIWLEQVEFIVKAANNHHALVARVEELEAALTRLRDCDWVITLPDRMDAVREIAGEALKGKEER